MSAGLGPTPILHMCVCVCVCVTSCRNKELTQNNFRSLPAPLTPTIHALVMKTYYTLPAHILTNTYNSYTGIRNCVHNKKTIKKNNELPVLKNYHTKKARILDHVQYHALSQYLLATNAHHACCRKHMFIHVSVFPFTAKSVKPYR